MIEKSYGNRKREIKPLSKCLQEWVRLNAKQYYYPNNKTTKNVNENMTTTRLGGAKSLKCL